MVFSKKYQNNDLRLQISGLSERWFYGERKKKNTIEAGAWSWTITILGVLCWYDKGLNQDDNESWKKEWAQKTCWKIATKFHWQDIQQMEIQTKKSLEGKK